MNKGIFIGNIAFQVEKSLKGTKNQTIGGSLYYAIPGAKLISTDFIPVSSVGSDFKMKILRPLCPTIKYINQINYKKTARFINTEKKSGRIFSEVPGVTKRIYTHNFPDIKNPSFIHLTTMSPQNQIDWLTFLRKKYTNSIKLSADLFELYTKDYPQLCKKVIQKVDLLFLNLDEFYRLNKYFDLKLNSPYILKMGSYGASYINKNLVIHVDAPKVKVVKTSGAGEILAAVFLMLVAKKVSIRNALEVAVYAASLSVTKIGTQHILENQLLKEKVKTVLN